MPLHAAAPEEESCQGRLTAPRRAPLAERETLLGGTRLSPWPPRDRPIGTCLGARNASLFCIHDMHIHHSGCSNLSVFSNILALVFSFTSTVMQWILSILIFLLICVFVYVVVPLNPHLLVTLRFRLP